MRKGFTLIELLVVIAIVAILAVVVILTLNPAQLIKQSRDSNRIAELATLNKALAIYTTDIGTSGLGAASTTYVSIPSPNSDCTGLGLPAQPAGWSYACVTAANLKNTDGTGWIPVNFQNVSFKSPLAVLPVDPINATSTLNYYTYTTSGGKYEMTTSLESDKYSSKEGDDGGADPALFEAGTNTSIAPFLGGLVGWWKLDEGSGGTAIDSSGYGDNGTWNGTSTSWYAGGKTGTSAGSLNGSSDYVQIPYNAVLNLQRITVTAWAKPSLATMNGAIFEKTVGGNVNTAYLLFTQGTNYVFRIIPSFTSNAPGLDAGSWDLIVGTYDGSNVLIYKNGSLVASTPISETVGNGNGVSYIGKLGTGATYFFNGLIDDVRVYNRALSATEIQAIYNATR